MADDLAGVEFETSKDVRVVTSFDKMGLKEDLLRGVYAYGTCTPLAVAWGWPLNRIRSSTPPGFEKPSAIQQRAVMPIITGRDVIAQAQSGTGKSSMIALTACQRVEIQTRE